MLACTPINRLWHKPMSIEVIIDTFRVTFSVLAAPRTRTARTLRDIHQEPVRQHSVCLWSLHGLYDYLAESSAHMQFLAVDTSSTAICSCRSQILLVIQAHTWSAAITAIQPVSYLVCNIDLLKFVACFDSSELQRQDPAARPPAPNSSNIVHTPSISSGQTNSFRFHWNECNNGPPSK